MIQSCSITRDLQPGEYLLKQNRILSTSPYPGEGELESFIQQKTGGLDLFRAKRWLYQYATRGRERWLDRVLLKTVATRPVVLDTLLSHTTARNMKLFLHNTGYFNAFVLPEFVYRKRFATVTYRVTPGIPYRVRNIRYQVPDDSLRQIVQGMQEHSLLKTGMVYDAYALDQERDRINLVLKNRGYYFFSKNYITYSIDSALGTNQLDVTLLLSNPAGVDSLGNDKGGRHRPYSLGRVTVWPEHDPLSADTAAGDTLYYLTAPQERDSRRHQYGFIFSHRLNIRPSAITQNLFLTPGETFNVDDVEQSYTRLSDLQLYRFVNIEFQPAADSHTVGPGLLDCMIRLSRNKIQSFSFETEGTNKGGDLGLAAGVVYENRNIFRGAELLQVRLKGAMEVQQRFGQIYEPTGALFNTFETGLQASLVFPKFLIPIRQERFSRYFRPKTTLNAGVNYQERSSFKRYRTEFSFGYDWKESSSKRHIFNPVEINAVSIFPDTAFSGYLNALTDKRLVDQYTDHFIMALRYSFIFNNQQINRKENFTYFRLNLESAGNLLSLANQAVQVPVTSEGYHTLLGIRFAQYLKSDGDFRFYNLLGKATLVYRAAAGLGYPYGNSTALPFDKGFYSGGANGMRGWPVRDLGPGRYNDDTLAVSYDKVGDILLETNLELRFPLFGWLNGALFTDAGNIWLLRPSSQYPGGDFAFGRVLSELALDAGLGFRFDFRFFVFRLDGAVQLHSPARAEGERWFIPAKMRPADIMWNFGIGYPF